MDIIQEIAIIGILIVLAFLAVIPMVRLMQLRSIGRYKNLRYFSYVIVLWTLLTLTIFMGETAEVLYYSQLMIYPSILLVIIYGIKTIYTFMRQEVPKLLERGLFVYFVMFFLLSMTNPLHESVIKLQVHEVTSRIDLMDSEVGWAFIMLMVVVFVVTIYSVSYFLVYIHKSKLAKVYKTPARLFLAVTVVGLAVNVFHVFVYTFSVDPTFITIVVFGYLLYHIVYKRDFNFALLLESRKALIGKMREMYILAAPGGEVIEASPKLYESFQLDENLKLQALINKIQEEAVLYQDLDDIKNLSLNKPYLYTIKKEFIPEGFEDAGTLILLYDETKFVKTIEKLEFLKSHDMMTGLLNRNHLEQEITDFESKYPRFGLILSDLNGLKIYNDYLGHKAGDELIIRYGDILSNVARKNDLKAFRIGGDEFLLFVSDVKQCDLKAVADELKTHSEDEDILKTISVSIGISERQSNETFEEALKRADRALYKAKETLSQEYVKALKEALNHKKH